MGEEKIEHIGDTKPEEPLVPEVDLKPFPKVLKYGFLDLEETYLVVMSDELSPEKMRSCWIY
jgi:hypothetical protein